MCRFCNEGELLETENGFAFIGKAIPFPAIDLTTGDEYEADEPYWEIVFKTEYSEDVVKISFCPFCGKRLEPDFSSQKKLLARLQELKKGR